MAPIRILVTGFSAFPRAPVNPTERLIEMIDASRWSLDDVELRTAVLPVEYGRVPGMLCELGLAFRPDVAIHFGLAETARGFRLERTARNRSSLAKPDAAGGLPPARAIVKGRAEALGQRNGIGVALGIDRPVAVGHRQAGGGGGGQRQGR